MNANVPTLTTFLVYLLMMIAIGVWVYRRTHNLGDYVLGGRSLRPSVAAMSAGASDMSGYLFLGVPGAVYAQGVGATWIAIGLILGTYFNWLFIAERLRTYTERAKNSLSLSSYFENRFEDRTQLLRIISALVIVVFFTVYVSSGLVASAQLFHSVFGISLVTAATIGFIVVAVYTSIGGFLADSFTDFIQGTMMFLALLVLPMIGLWAIGGFAEVGSAVSEKSPDLWNMGDVVAYENGAWGAGDALGFVAIVSGLSWGLGYFGMPHILARFMGIRSAKDVPVARRIGTGWVILSLAGACAVGLLGIGLIDKPLDNPEDVFFALANQLTNPWIAGLLQAALLAAVMSTVDSQLIIVSTALTEDFYRKVNKRASDKQLLWVGRGGVVLVGIVAFVLALIALGSKNPADSSILLIVAHAWAGFGAAFGPVILLSLFWPRMTWVGALAGMVVGAVVALSWPTLDEKFFGTGLYELVPGFALALLAAWGFGHLGRRPEREWKGKYEDYLPDEPEAAKP
ncbi:sodium/proline symporter PutP [Stackebrandtia nassauensis]|uniref:Sodium/proline symporter n=1 Tax=Stackebrandtia nassauensis (strain DSM 44728 / CIP 108903 / NRRL B-16338 / NBRC 102104 / LLR-40K-21) TaxID=446470 RepID=D3Q4E6_STANL|nr:sodium/proline symporter PutP [Stackebrandtia nassauensis]ADD40106.1 sodium/proline symporter [Stackebrandtia nassauensis DSM 44728]